MDFINIEKSQPIMPDVELDGGYAYCVKCYTELEPRQKVCPNCQQAQDWSWLNKKLD